MTARTLVSAGILGDTFILQKESIRIDGGFVILGRSDIVENMVDDGDSQLVRIIGRASDKGPNAAWAILKRKIYMEIGSELIISSVQRRPRRYLLTCWCLRSHKKHTSHADQ